MILPPCWKVKRISRVCEFTKFATFRRVWSSLPSLRHIWGLILLTFLLTPLLVFQTAPARAQGVFVTPTPFPAIVATTNAATQAQAQANASLQQAARLRASAAEMERNGIAQYAQAQADITTAREAAATQNGVAAGEAIGRLGATVDEQNKTVMGQAAIIATLTTNQELTARQNISLTTEVESLRIQVQSLRVDKQTIQANFTAASQALDDAKRQGTSSSVSTLVIGALVLLAFLVVIIVIVQRKKSQPEHITVTSAPPDNAASDTSDVIDMEDDSV